MQLVAGVVERARRGQNGVDNGTTTGLGTIPTGAVGSNINGTIHSAAVTLSPSQLNWNNPSQPIFPSANSIDCSPLTGSPCDILGVSKNLKTPYVVSWNFNVQQALSSTTTLQVAYVGNHGVHLYIVRDMNQVNQANDDGTE